MRLLPAFSLILLTTPAALSAQNAENPSAHFRTAANVVLIPATVLDRRGALVPGLPSSAFSVTEDSAPRPIISFSEQDLPASIGIVFDTSGSMRGALPQAKAVLRAFLDTSNPEDEAFIYSVSSRPIMDSGFTSDFGSLLSSTLFRSAEGSTALVDTVFAAVRSSRSARNPRKALLVVSDGMDNHSRYSKSELIAAAVESDVQIYSVVVYDPPRNKKPLELREEREGIDFLKELSRRTGGICIVALGDHDIAHAALQIGRAIRDQYLLGYVAGNNATDGRWHSVKVRLAMPNTTIYARSGFFAR